MYKVKRSNEELLVLQKILLVAAAASALSAQSQLNGKFIFSEEDALGVIEFDGKGNVAGAEFKQHTGVVLITGTYNLSADGSGSLSLFTQTTDDEGVAAPVVLATYRFMQAGSKGFSAMQTNKGTVSVAKFSPAYTAKSLSGNYSFESESKNASGEERAEIGLVQFIADGNLAGKQIVTQSGVTDLFALTGSYALEANGFWAIRIFTPGTPDEDGQTGFATTALTAVASADGTVYALRRSGSQPGVITFEPSR